LDHLYFPIVSGDINPPQSKSANVHSLKGHLDVEDSQLLPMSALAAVQCSLFRVPGSVQFLALDPTKFIAEASITACMTTPTFVCLSQSAAFTLFCFHLFSMFYVACILFSDYHVSCDCKCDNLVFWSIWECEDNKSMANALGLFLLNRSRSRLNSCRKLWTDPPMSLKLGNCQDRMDVISLALVRPLKISTFRGTS
jgi:hypothetical protein